MALTPKMTIGSRLFWVIAVNDDTVAAEDFSWDLKRADLDGSNLANDTTPMEVVAAGTRCFVLRSVSVISTAGIYVGRAVYDTGSVESKSIALSASVGDFNHLVKSVWDYLTASITEVGSIGKRIKDYVDTTISSRGTSTVTTSEVKTQADQAIADANSNIPFKIVTDGSNTATTFKTDLTSGTTDFYKSPTLVRCISGDNASQVRKLLPSGSYNATTKFITIAGEFANTPTGDDDYEFIIT